MKIFYLFLSLLAIVLWGLALLATRILIEHNFSLNFITLCRFALAALLLKLTIRPRHRQTIAKSDLKYFALMAVGGISLFYFFENSGVKYTTISNTSLIIATIPLFTLLLARIVYGKKMSWQNIWGLPLGLVGTALLFIKDFHAGNTLHLKGDFLVLGSVLFWLIYSFAYRKIMHKYNTIFITYITILWGALFLLPSLLWEFSQIATIIINPSVILALLFLGIFSSYLAYLIWNISITKIGLKITSNLVLFSPIVSISAGIIWLNEPFGFNLILSTLAIIAGAYLTSHTTPGEEF
ncbi:MAG: DMT family transporter [Candidatus Cloacimonadales bacterium]